MMDYFLLIVAIVALGLVAGGVTLFASWWTGEVQATTVPSGVETLDGIRQMANVSDLREGFGTHVSKEAGGQWVRQEKRRAYAHTHDAVEEGDLFIDFEVGTESKAPELVGHLVSGVDDASHYSGTFIDLRPIGYAEEMTTKIPAMGGGIDQ